MSEREWSFLSQTSHRPHITRQNYYICFLRDNEPKLPLKSIYQIKQFTFQPDDVLMREKTFSNRILRWNIYASSKGYNNIVIPLQQTAREKTLREETLSRPGREIIRRLTSSPRATEYASLGSYYRDYMRTLERNGCYRQRLKVDLFSVVQHNTSLQVLSK